MAIRNEARRPLGPSNCHWLEGRWHLGNQGIHAGERLWLRALHVEGAPFDDEGRPTDHGPGAWRCVRIESTDQGRVLLAYTELEGVTWVATLRPEHELSWTEPSS